MPNETGWGGIRPGSGRKQMPAELKKKTIAFRLSVEEKAAVDAMLRAMRLAKKRQKEMTK